MNESPITDSSTAERETFSFFILALPTQPKTYSYSIYYSNQTKKYKKQKRKEKKRNTFYINLSITNLHDN
jgi:hypothetical protein